MAPELREYPNYFGILLSKALFNKELRISLIYDGNKRTVPIRVYFAGDVLIKAATMPASSEQGK